MTLADQLKIDRVQPQPYTRAQVEIERELFADRPPLRDPHEAQQMSLKEWIAASGLDAEHRKFAKGAISAIAADTRKALSVYRDGKQRGIDQMVLAEIVREGVIRGQEAIRAAGNAEMSKGADASARFHALHAIAEKHAGDTEYQHCVTRVTLSPLPCGVSHKGQPTSAKASQRCPTQSR